MILKLKRPGSQKRMIYFFIMTTTASFITLVKIYEILRLVNGSDKKSQACDKTLA